MGLEPEGLVGDQRIGGGVGFVEAVARKLLHQIEDLYRQFAVDAVLDRPFLKPGSLLGHLGRVFLAHGPAQHVRPTQGVTRQHLGYLHHLLLIEDDAVGGFKDRFETLVLPLLVRVGDRLLAVLSLDEVVHHARLERARTEQGHQGDHVFETVRLQPFDEILHAAGFELEYRRGLEPLQQIERLLVVDGDGGDVDRRLALFGKARVYHAERPVDDGQGTQPQEVELHQPGIFHIVLVELGDRVIAGVVAVKRRKVGDLGGRYYHATCVFAGVAHHAFQPARHVDEVFDLLVLLIKLGQLGLGLECLGQGHARIRRDQLGDAIDETIGVAQHPAHVPYHRLGRHAAEGDDLGHRIPAIHVGDVLDHLVPSVHAEVDVEVGHGYPLRVQEAFEQQVKFQRVEVGDLERVSHQ